MTNDSRSDRAFRFFDNREKYLLFVNTCNEKQVIAERVSMAAKNIQPMPPALRLFDAGMGDATVLTRVMRFLHYQFPTVPQFVVGKEISEEDIRISLDKMADRFHEHPQTALVLTNMYYTEAPWLYPKSRDAQANLNWLEVPLEGTTAFEFDEQIKGLGQLILDWWRTKQSDRTGNTVSVKPSVLVIYRKDQKWPLNPIIPRKGDTNHEYDIVIAAQPFRARSSVEVKVRNVLSPLARSLSPDGCMVVVQSTGHDPGMEIIRKIWPGENPFQTPGQELLRQLHTQLADANPDVQYKNHVDSHAQFHYSLQLRPGEAASSIGTSTLLAAWNAAVYVAQIDDERLGDAMSRGDYLDATREVLQKHGGLWFTDESFTVVRARKGDSPFAVNSQSVRSSAVQATAKVSD
jgi:hypothetical protein